MPPNEPVFRMVLALLGFGALIAVFSCVLAPYRVFRGIRRGLRKNHTFQMLSSIRLRPTAIARGQLESPRQDYVSP